jgi:cell shape-determining protein MreC
MNPPDYTELLQEIKRLNARIDELESNNKALSEENEELKKLLHEQGALTVIQFFTGLSITKSQSNSLLAQLSRGWEQEYDHIAKLLSDQMVIYIDETGWKVGKKACYTWA